MGGKQNISPRDINACENYLKGMPLRKALLEAGYSPNYCEGNAHLFNWIKRRHICSYIRQRQLEIAQLCNTDKAYVVTKLKHIVDSDDPKDRTKALELLDRLVVPKEPNELRVEDVKGITISFSEAKKE